MTEKFTPKPYFDPNAPRVPQPPAPPEKITGSGYQATTGDTGFLYYTGDNEILVFSIYPNGVWCDDAFERIEVAKYLSYDYFIIKVEKYLKEVNQARGSI